MSLQYKTLAGLAVLVLVMAAASIFFANKSDQPATVNSSVTSQPSIMQEETVDAAAQEVGIKPSPDGQNNPQALFDFDNQTQSDTAASSEPTRSSADLKDIPLLDAEILDAEIEANADAVNQSTGDAALAQETDVKHIGNMPDDDIQSLIEFDKQLHSDSSSPSEATRSSADLKDIPLLDAEILDADIEANPDLRSQSVNDAARLNLAIHKDAISYVLKPSELA